VSEFHTTLFAAGYSAGPGTAAGVPDLLSLWNAYAIKGIVHNDTSWAGCTVPSQLKASGLSEERFRGDGEEGSWDALPGVAMNLAIRHKVRFARWRGTGRCGRQGGGVQSPLLWAYQAGYRAQRHLMGWLHCALSFEG
jgi:hypothetical protein